MIYRPYDHTGTLAKFGVCVLNLPQPSSFVFHIFKIPFIQEAGEHIFCLTEKYTLHQIDELLLSEPVNRMFGRRTEHAVVHRLYFSNERHLY